MGFDSGGDRTGNCPAGFVADEGIDSPLAADFFLLSHGGLLGSEFGTPNECESA